MVGTGERPFIDVPQDKRYRVIHLVTIPSLFLSGAPSILSGFVYKLSGIPTLNQYFSSDKPYMCTINDRFSALSEIEGGWFYSHKHSQIRHAVCVAYFGSAHTFKVFFVGSKLSTSVISMVLGHFWFLHFSVIFGFREV